MEIRVDPTSRTVTLSLGGTFSAEQLHETIKALCAARKQIAQDPENPEGLPVEVIANARWHTSPFAGDPQHSLVMMLIPGFGWTGMTVTAVDRVRLAACLVAQQADYMRLTTAGTSATNGNYSQGSGGALH